MSHNPYSILLVDDDPDDRLLFVEALSIADESVRCTMAVDGIDALEQLRMPDSALPDVIFLDVNMPRMNGIDCLRELKNFVTTESIPVVMYSTSTHYQNECLESGATHYLEKPNEFGKLCEKLKQILTQGIPYAKHPDSVYDPDC